MARVRYIHLKYVHKESLEALSSHEVECKAYCDKLVPFEQASKGSRFCKLIPNHDVDVWQPMYIQPWSNLNQNMFFFFSVF